jgi:hypothetical protein
MGAFLSLMSGLAKGASSKYNELAEEERKNKIRQNELMASSLEQRLEKDDSLTPEEQHHLLGQILSLRGIDPKTAQHIINASGYLRNQMEEEARKTGGVAPPIKQSFDIPALGDMPAQTAQVSIPASEFGPMPQYQSRTAGEIKFERKLPQDIAEANLKQKAMRDAQLAEATGLMEAKLQVLQKYKDTPLEDEVRYMLGAAPRSGASTFLPGNGIRGKDLKAYFPDAKDIDENKLYKVSFGPDKKTPVAYFPVSEDTVAGKAAQGSNFTQFATDMVGNPRDDSGMYTPVRARAGGAIIGIVPETELGSFAVRHNFKQVTQPDGSVALIPVTETSETKKTLPGGQPISAQAAQTQAPASPQGQSPFAPLPTPPASHPILTGPNPYSGGVKTGTIVGGKPLTEGEFKNLSSAKQGLRMLAKLREGIAKDPYFLEKAATGASQGAAWRNELSDIITRLRTGAALNQEEQHFYQSQLPGLKDKLASKILPGEKNLIDSKLKIYEDLFNGVIQQYGRRAMGGYKPGDFEVKPPTEFQDNTKASPNSPLPSRSSSRSASSTSHKVGDTVIHQGKQYRITAIDAKTGEAELEPVGGK